jgi:drug/metabolite transporter (DMT)-like permease
MPTNDNNNDDKRGKIDEEEEKKVVPASFPTERDPLIWRDNNHGDDKKNHPLHGAGLPLPPRRPAAAAALPRRPPGAAAVVPGLAAHPPPVIGAHRRAASTTHVETGQKLSRPGLLSRHFRNRSSLRQIMTEDILPGLRSESVLFGGQLRQSLHDAQAGRTFFLDMSMTRSLSVLPEDMTDLVEETVLSQIPHPKRPNAATLLEQKEDEEEYLEAGAGAGDILPKKAKTTESMALQCASLLLAVMAVSSNGTALTLLHGVPPALKLYWRMTVTGLALFGLALPRLSVYGWPVEMSTWPKLLSLLCAATCFAGQGLCFVHALQYTSIGNVVIGANSQAILLVIGKLVGGEVVHWLEGGGVLLAFAGCLMCAQDEARERGAVVDPTAPPTSFFERSVGEMLAFGAGIFGVLYLILAKSIRPHMPVSLFVSCVMLLGSILVIPFCYLAAPNRVTWSTDPDFGFLGWTSSNRVFVIAHIVFVCNLLGTVGFVRAMQYFDNLIIAVATLLEPLIATIIAFILGVGLLPGPLGWLGNLVVVIGTLGVVIPSINSKEGGASAAAH